MAASVYKWLKVSITGSLFIIYVFNSTNDFFLPVKEVKRNHPFHVSTTEINHNTKDKILEISCRIFTDDFENVLEKNYKIKVDLTHPPSVDKNAVDKLVSDYIKRHLQLKADNIPVSLSYVGFEIDHDGVYAYFQVDNISSVKRIDINDSILHDVYSDQISIIHVIVGGNRKSMKLDYPDTYAKFEF